MWCVLPYHNEVHTKIMKPEIKQRWIQALRSGEYQQTKGTLHNDKGFCCLGVLCDLYAKEHSHHSWVLYGDRYKMIDETGILPIKVKRWAGLNENNPIIEGYASLAELNDGCFTFEQIAQIIEEQL